MRERPILFSGEMVRAILDGRKTQTRRVIVPAPRECNGTGRWSWCASSTDRGSVGQWAFRDVDEHGATWTERGRERTLWTGRCPYGQPGDLLWVREAYRLPASLDKLSPSAVASKALDAGYHSPWAPIYYEADGRKNGARRESTFAADWGTDGKLRPSIHMPRWASRLTLRVVDVRAERLQAISEADAAAEGVRATDAAYVVQAGGDRHPELEHTHRGAFACLWDSINHKRGFSWNSDPWVWAVTFEVVP